MTGRQQLDDMGINALLLEHTMYKVHYSAVGTVCITTALERAGVACLETKREYVKTYIRTGLIYHSYHTERDTYTSQFHAVGTNGLAYHLADRIGKAGHAAHIRCDTCQTLLIEKEAVIHGIGFIHAGQVLGIGLEECIGVALYGIGHRHQYVIHLTLIQHGERE